MTERICMNCETPIPQEAVYCPNCGVDVKQYVKDNAKDLLFKKPEREESLEKPKVGTGMIIALIVLCILFLPLGLIAALLVWYNNKKKVEEWQRDKIITNTQS